MPLTALGGDTGTLVIGENVSTGVYPQTLHPSIAPYQAALASASYVMTRTEINAVNNLVWGMEGAGLWSKMKAVYLFIGGSAATHKFNFKNPLDTDAAFRLTFTGGWVHSSTGAKGNGTTAWANTYLTPGVTLSATSGHLAYYSRTQAIETNAIEIGSQNATTTITALVCVRSSISASSFRYGASGNTNAIFNGTVSTGLFIGSQLGSAIGDRNIYHNGKRGTIPTTLTASTLPATAPLSLNGFNDNNLASRTNLSTKECAYASIGDGLSPGDARNLYVIVQAFQTALGRQVV